MFTKTFLNSSVYPEITTSRVSSNRVTEMFSIYRTCTVVAKHSRNFHLSAMAPVAVGDKIPSVTLFEDTPGGKGELASLCAGKKVVIFGVPGAFTPGCSKTHLPGYVSAAEGMKAKGVEEIVCMSVNDPFVMEAS